MRRRHCSPLCRTRLRLCGAGRFILWGSVTHNDTREFWCLTQHHKLKNFYHGVLLSYGQLGVSRRKRWFSYQNSVVIFFSFVLVTIPVSGTLRRQSERVHTKSTKVQRTQRVIGGFSLWVIVLNTKGFCFHSQMVTVTFAQPLLFVLVPFLSFW